MENWATRLKRMRLAVRLSQAKAGKQLGIKGPSIAQWESGRSKPALDRLPELADLYQVTLEELCGTDLGSPEAARRAASEGLTTSEIVRVAGCVAAADRVVIYNQDELQGEGISLPFRGYPGYVLRVTGESMVPRYKPDELVGFRLPGAPYPSFKMIGRDVVAKLDDGQILLKTLINGPTPESFALASVNPMVPPIFDPPFEWISPIDFHLVDWN
ncbi:XRE family transcriptional regulator [Gluconacetobacter entanii]|nr:XRE family transcriptional regulator [Gluconacetobacter entanii]